MPIGFVLDYLYHPLLITVAHYQSYTLDVAEICWCPLSIAAGDQDQGTGITAVGQPQQLAALAVSDVGYGAGVQQVNVSSMVGSNNLVANLEELAS
jgi:hypothetical protein